MTVVLYTDVIPDGGPTLICPKALPKVLEWMRDHPEGGYSNKVIVEIMKDFSEDDFVYVGLLEYVADLSLQEKRVMFTLGIR